MQKCIYRIKMKVSKVTNCDREDLEKYSKYYDEFCYDVMKSKRKFCQTNGFAPQNCQINPVNKETDVKEDYMYVSMIYRDYSFDIFDFLEEITDNYPVNIECVAAEEYEGDCKIVKYSYDGTSFRATKYYPQTAEECHLFFLMSWWNFGSLTYTGKDFYNQRGIEDSSFFIVNEDGTKDIPDLSTWLKQYDDLLE